MKFREFYIEIIHVESLEIYVRNKNIFEMFERTYVTIHVEIYKYFWGF